MSRQAPCKPVGVATPCYLGLQVERRRVHDVALDELGALGEREVELVVAHGLGRRLQLVEQLAQPAARVRVNPNPDPDPDPNPNPNPYPNPNPGPNANLTLTLAR